MCYICVTSDQTVHRTNIFQKYIDDTYLIIPCANCSLITDELSNVTQWASTNNLRLNPNKSYETIVYLPDKKPICFPRLVIA